MQDYPSAILENFAGDYRAAYEHLAKAYLGLERKHVEQSASRFIEIGRPDDSTDIYVAKVTEEQISRDVDMSDCWEPIERRWLYVDDSGELLPVTIGRQERINTDQECPFHFAASAIMAGGRQVGEVIHTDH